MATEGQQIHPASLVVARNRLSDSAVTSSLLDPFTEITFIEMMSAQAGLYFPYQLRDPTNHVSRLKQAGGNVLELELL